MTELKLAFD